MHYESLHFFTSMILVENIPGHILKTSQPAISEDLGRAAIRFILFELPCLVSLRGAH